MRIIEAFPPNWDAIKAAFPDIQENVIFSYAPDIYNPYKLRVSPQHIAHEQVHFVQQEEIGLDPWWKKFLKDPKFRAEQELPAYRAEYNFLKGITSDREKLARAAHHFAGSLSGPNYGDCISYRDAHAFITGGKRV